MVLLPGDFMRAVDKSKDLIQLFKLENIGDFEQLRVFRITVFGNLDHQVGQILLPVRVTYLFLWMLQVLPNEYLFLRIVEKHKSKVAVVQERDKPLLRVQLLSFRRNKELFRRSKEYV